MLQQHTQSRAGAVGTWILKIVSESLDLFQGIRRPQPHLRRCELRPVTAASLLRPYPGTVKHRGRRSAEMGRASFVDDAGSPSGGLLAAVPTCPGVSGRPLEAAAGGTPKRDRGTLGS